MGLDYLEPKHDIKTSKASEPVICPLSSARAKVIATLNTHGANSHYISNSFSFDEMFSRFENILSCKLIISAALFIFLSSLNCRLCINLHLREEVLCVQKVVTRFISCKLLYKMGNYFLDT